MKSAEHQISGSPTRIFLTLTIAFHLATAIHTRTARCLENKWHEPLRVSRERTARQRLQSPWKSTSCDNQDFDLQLQHIHNTNRFSRTHEWPAPDRITNLQMSPSVKCFTTGRNAFSHCRKNGDVWDPPWHSACSFLDPFGVPSCSSLPWYFLGAPAGGGNSF